ncbi:DICT sensory domain-containing protein [Nocardioides sp.]|uniref:DICT sensory domain-containing protein n=1 Tax=Nocardioides sp. TaxID=35761 RepID=UPI002734CF4D|nr:DICT sensory domain-containing protein [Nocardioides sp.]MDP3894449.1 DICT sensory domain-containing protein [Nocardioides sp.]
MTTDRGTAQPPTSPGADRSPDRGPDRSTGEVLTIGELAKATGLSAELLRMWETRHGFPLAQRLPSGHRRYRAEQAETVRAVLRLRDQGVRLEQAIARATSAEHPPPESVFAHLRSRFPHLLSTPLRKRTVLALSWAIEDECCAQAHRPMLFGAFQDERYYRASRSRWEELARVASSTVVLADFPDGGTPDSSPELVSLPASSPMHREWVIVCESPDFPAALSAWEIPGQDGVAEADRLFETLWTIDPAAVREAARVCAGVAQESGSPSAAALLFELASTPESRVGNLTSITTLFNRVVAYVDRSALLSDTSGSPRGPR